MSLPEDPEQRSIAYGLSTALFILVIVSVLKIMGIL